MGCFPFDGLDGRSESVFSAAEKPVLSADEFDMESAPVGVRQRDSCVSVILSSPRCMTIERISRSAASGMISGRSPE